MLEANDTLLYEYYQTNSQAYIFYIDKFKQVEGIQFCLCKVYNICVKQF